MLHDRYIHNRASDLPCATTSNGVVINGSNFAQVHEATQRSW
jgi:hypothetical protein